MTVDDAALASRRAAPRSRAVNAACVFGLVGGPLGWYVQLCAGYALASWPCFPTDERTVAPIRGYDWTWPAMTVALLAGAAVALAALFVSYQAFRRAQHASSGDQRHLIESGGGRTSFLALWGMLLGAGFALTTLITAIAFVILPRCAG
jgi:hypothetical protein